MSDSAGHVDRLLDLAGTVFTTSASEDELAELDTILLADEASRHHYLNYCLLHVALRVDSRARRAIRKTHQRISLESSSLEPSASITVTCSHPAATAPRTAFVVPHGLAGYFSSGWPLAYLIATVIFAGGLLIGALTHVSSYEQVTGPACEERQPLRQTEPEIVGRITGAVDCNVFDAKRTIVTVHLGQKIELVSGMMEITYNTGAKVLLQGPATYTINLLNGGLLSVGKLTGRVEAEAARGFAIRTPTAMVTDLGTEFGVEVDQHGITTSHVFRGSIKVQAMVGGSPDGDGLLVRVNESARVASGPNGRPVAAVVPAANPAAFVRELRGAAVKVLDLVDVVAGGDGFSHNRGRGVDPTSGRFARTAPPDDFHFKGDGRYHRVTELPFIDGVCIPHDGNGSTQIDSAGHVFAGFPNTANSTYGYIWAGGSIPIQSPPAVSTELNGVDYSTAGHGVLLTHANSAITFDLQAIRRANVGWKPIRFRTVTGNLEDDSANGRKVWADVWVLLDGRVMFKRREVTRCLGAMPVSLPIHDHDRFLTLAGTDSGNGIDSDDVMFGDPRLELAPESKRERP